MAAILIIEMVLIIKEQFALFFPPLLESEEHDYS